MAGTIVNSIVITIIATIVVITIVKIVRCCKLSKIRKIIATKLTTQTNSQSSSLPIYQDGTVEMDSMERFLEKILSERPVRYNSDQVKQITDNFATVLGKGGFGVVYKGKFLNGLDVAVKVLNATVNKRCEEQFMAEIGTVGRTFHKNLVKLYGFCFDESTKALLYEYMENGSLDGHLFGKSPNGGDRLGLERLHGVAVGTAKGIRYLHEECQQQIVHYDIKPANVLLKSDFTPKVSDFGLAKYCERQSDLNPAAAAGVFTGGRGTPGYAAPELWNMGLRVTYKCDVYSFGMLLFEILGRRRNFEFNMASESQEWFPRYVWQKFAHNELGTVLDQCGFGDGEMREKAEKMCEVALWCVQYDPDARPTMTGVIRMLEGEMDIVPPVDPFVYMSDSTPPSGTSSSGTGIGTGTASSGAYTTGNRTESRLST